MRYPLLAFVFFMVVVHGDLPAQEREKITAKSGEKYSMIEEVYYVLKEDKTHRDGSYPVAPATTNCPPPLISGYYDHGKKDLASGKDMALTASGFPERVM